jgi:hypothetical protein
MLRVLLMIILMLSGQSLIAACAQEANPTSELDQFVLGASVVALSDARDVFQDADVRLPVKAGVLLADVTAYGPAQIAGLTKMDIITRVNKSPVTTVDEFKEAVALLDPTKECELTGYRATPSKTGKVSWKRGSVKAKPVKRRDLFLNTMRTKVDEVRDVVSYTHRDSTEFLNSASEVYCYINKGKNAKPTLRLHIQYVADDWLFVRRFSIKAGDRTFQLDASTLGSVERDNSGGKVWEWYDRAVDADMNEMLAAVVASNRAILRFEGDKYQKDLELSEGDRDRIKTVLAVHEILLAE